MQTELGTPLLQRVLEAVAEALDMDHGQQRLELIFEDGRLRTWWTHDERNSPGELRRYDAATGPAFANAGLGKLA